MVPEELIIAYRETVYHVFASPPFALRVDEQSSELLSYHRSRGVESSAFISAFNPYSSPLSDDENRRRHVEFGRELSEGGISVIEGLGQHPTSGWPGEPSYLLLGVSLETARAIGAKREQNAILWMGSDAVPQLTVLR